jgi:ribosomal-protein-alanine N-acetyltransferase
VRHPNDRLDSERLTLRRFTLADRETLARMHADLDVMRYAGGTLDAAASEAMLRGRILDYYEQHPGLGVWATIERDTGTLVGMHLLNHVRGEPDIQVGYLLFKEHWGRGYATEMARRVLRYGFAELGVRQIVGITDQPNVASQQVLLKIGLERRGERSLAQYSAEPLAWFQRDAEDWLAEHPA